jgi:hypothetical protein
MDNEIILLGVCIVLVVWYIFIGSKGCYGKKRTHNEGFESPVVFPDTITSLYEPPDKMYFPRKRSSTTSFDGTTPDGYKVPYMTLNERSMLELNHPPKQVKYINGGLFGSYF